MIEQQPARLREVDSIAPDRTRKISAAWDARLAFLHGDDVPTSAGTTTLTIQAAGEIGVAG